MAIALRPRRVVTAKIETTRGTIPSPAPTVSSDAVPQIREATFSITPVVVERPTLRLSLTDFPDIYPGKSTAELTIAVEVHGRDSGFPTSPPHWTRLLRACAMKLFDESANIFAYKVIDPVTDNGPLRHGEALGGTALGGTNNFSFGDGFSRDGGALTTIFVDEGATPGTSSGTITSQRTSANTTFTINARSTQKCLGWAPQSDINLQDTVTADIFADQKALRVKGLMGNAEFAFTHGDACIVTFTMQGVVPVGGYLDLTIPAGVYEGHKVPPTFLGSRLSLSDPINNPGTSQRYGTGGAAGQALLGSLNSVRLSTGNTVVLQQNSLDPDGVQFAFITDRAPTGSFNPQEVLEGEFSFLSRFVAGNPVRMHILLGATSHTDPSTQDQNTFEFLAPGLVNTQLGDIERDGVNTWDGGFSLTGGDYDSSATGELPGNDNEFVIVHR